MGEIGDDEILRKIRALSESQREWLNNLLDRFSRDIAATTLPTSDIASAPFMSEFGDVLRIHHSLLSEAFTKDKFEHALVRVQGGEAE